MSDDEVIISQIPVKDVEDLPTKRDVYSQIRSYAYGVDFCIIPKTGSMITNEILCDMLRDYKGIPFKRKFEENITGINDCGQYFYYPNNHVEKWKRAKKQLNFTIIRDPIERFASYYGHFCAMLSQCEGKDIHQFARWVYFMLKNKIKPKTHLIGGLLYHGYPQAWFCELKSDKKIELIHYTHNKEKLQKDFLRIFKKAKIPKKISKQALQHLKKSSTVHAAKGSKRQKFREQIVTNPSTMEYIRAIYHDDFDLINKDSVE